MPTFLSSLIAAAFVAATFSVHAADEDQSSAPGVEQAASPMDQDGQGDTQSSATEGADQGDVTSPLPAGDGPSDKQ
jgi:hypothetical protein